MHVTGRAFETVTGIGRNTATGVWAPNLVGSARLLLHASAVAAVFVVILAGPALIWDARLFLADRVAGRTLVNAPAFLGIQILMWRTTLGAAGGTDILPARSPSAVVDQIRTMARATHRSLAFDKVVAVHAGEGDLFATVVLDPDVDRTLMTRANGIESNFVTLAIAFWVPGFIGEDIRAVVNRTIFIDVDGQDSVVASTCVGADTSLRLDLPGTGNDSALGGCDRLLTERRTK